MVSASGAQKGNMIVDEYTSAVSAERKFPAAYPPRTWLTSSLDAFDLPEQER